MNLDELEVKLRRFEELQEQLAKPEVASDHKKCQVLAKELSCISPVIRLYKEYKRVEKKILEAEEIIKDKKHDEQFKQLAKEEVQELKVRKDKLASEIQQKLQDEEEAADRNCIMEIRAGTGGLEASIFAADLYRMYSKFAAKNGWKIEVMSSNPTEAGGFKEVIFSVSGKNTYKTLMFESGTHRVQRVPATEAQGRIHTSAATVAVLPEPEEVEVQIQPGDLRIDAFRSSGHGGQSVNTTDSAVRITHLPTNTIVTCQDERSQLKNKQKAMKVLRARLFEKQMREQQEKLSKERKLQVGSGDRSQKIRTYNFPDRRVTDHRINFTSHNLADVLDGNLDEITEALNEKSSNNK